MPLHEAPEVGVQTPESLPHLERRLGVGDGGFDFEAIADDARIGEKRSDLPPIVAGNLLGIEPIHGLAVVLALLQDGLPAQPRLRPLQNQELEEPPVIVKRDPPFPIVVGESQFGLRPRAAPQQRLSVHQVLPRRDVRRISCPLPASGLAGYSPAPRLPQPAFLLTQCGAGGTGWFSSLRA